MNRYVEDIRRDVEQEIPNPTQRKDLAALDTNGDRYRDARLPERPMDVDLSQISSYFPGPLPEWLEKRIEAAQKNNK